MDTINDDKYKAKDIFTFEFVKTVLKGVGQVMFQNNALTGLLFLIGIFWGAFEEGLPHVAWGAEIGRAHV